MNRGVGRAMSKARLETFSDGVAAIVLTIMVLELHVPHGTSLADLREVAPGALAYGLSFCFVGMQWCGHHHLLHAAERVDGSILWANLHFLFWLSLLPFATRWMGHGLQPVPTALYGCCMLLTSLAFFLLEARIIALHGGSTCLLGRAVGQDRKGRITCLAYAVACPLALLQPTGAAFCYCLVALAWLVPDRRIELAQEVGDGS